jgi:hypothetical protein
MAAGSSAHAAREPDAGIARLQLFAVRSQLPFEQFALSGKRFHEKADPRQVLFWGRVTDKADRRPTGGAMHFHTGVTGLRKHGKSDI